MPQVFGGIDGIITTYSVIVTGVGGMMAVGLVIKMAVSNLITDGWSMGFGEYMAQMAERSRENAGACSHQPASPSCSNHCVPSYSL